MTYLTSSAMLSLFIYKEQPKDLNSGSSDDAAKWMLREQMKQYYN